jgi:hypothetical protein
VWGWLAGQGHAQDTSKQRAHGKVQLVYRAPSSCPARETFEARLATRLRGAPLATDKPVVLTVELRGDERVGAQPPRAATQPRFLGTISLTDAEATLGPRKIEAQSCSEAVDALTFVAALLLEDHARAAVDVRSRADDARASNAGARPRATTPAVRANTRATSPTLAPEAVSDEPSASEPVSPTAPDEPTSSIRTEVAAPPVPAAALATGDSPSERDPPNDDADTTTPEFDAMGPARAWPVRGSLSVAGLLVSGVAPLLRPGVAVSAGLAWSFGETYALSLALGVRGTWPHEERSTQGNGEFRWWSSSFSLCARVQSERDAARVSLCLDGEAGEIVAHGRATDDPHGVRATWLAVGPAARASVRLRGRWRVVPGFGLLVPGARDRFVVGTRELYRVSPLTFRGELALAVEWP